MSVDIHRASPQKRLMKILSYIPSFRALLAINIGAALLLAACNQGGTVDGKVSDARARNDAPAIWVVEDFDSTLYLFGTVHLLDTDIDWIRDDMTEAFRSAGTVFFEVDTGTNAQSTAAVMTQSLGFNTGGRRLRDSLDSYQLKLLEAAANNSAIPIETLDSLQPWLASELLVIAAANDAGLSPALSADDALKNRAERQQKNIRYLDDIEAQITRTAAQPTLVQMSMLTDTLEGYNTLGRDIRTIAANWAVGRTEYLTDEVVNRVRDSNREIYDALYKDLNADWAAQFTRFMEGSGTGFAAIGIGHLLGDDSIQSFMEEQGYEVNRHYAFMGDPVIVPINPTITPRPQD